MTPNETILWTDEVLLKKISLGDENAFRLIFDRYRKKVYTYALKVIKSPVLAEDVLVEIFLKIWQHEDPSRIENLDSYLKTATRNHTLNMLRRQQLEEKISLELAKDWKEDHNETEESIFLKESEAILEQAIELLPPQQKLVFKLCRVEGLKYDEVAERLSISKLTVKTHMQHALRFLRNHVNNHDVIMMIVFLRILNEKNIF